MENEISLTPAQQKAARGLLGGIQKGNVLVLKSECGLGKTTALRKVHATVGGAFIGVREFMQSLMAGQPAGIEEAFVETVGKALASHDVVILDDLHLVTNVTNGCDYPRAYLLNAALTAILDDAAARRKKLVFAVDECGPPPPVECRAYSWTIAPFTAADYECVCRAHLAQAADRLDYGKIHRFAPGLNAYQLRAACIWLGQDAELDTARFTEYLRSQNMASNVELEEVPPVDWNDLKGVAEVIEALEAKIALPFENDALAAELGLKPKRGVLLAGPPEPVT